MSDLEESAPDPSDPETQFIPQEDDNETLWEVIEITAEKKKLYKVRWKGIDPKTQKPWPQSWVAKHDCTDDLVRDWKSRQARKKKKILSKRESKISRESRATTSVRSSGSIPPRKKRKLEVEVVISREPSAGSAEVNDDLKDRKRKSSRVITSDNNDDNYAEVKSKLDKEEVDERMVEERLSVTHYSQRPSPSQEPTCNQEEEGTPTSPVPAQSPAHIQQDTAEESTPTVSGPQHEMERRIDPLPTVLASTSSKPDPPKKKRPRPSSLSSSSAATESHTTTNHPILSQVARSRSTPRPKKRMKTITVSKQKWEELNDFQSQQVADPEMAPGHDKSEKRISQKLPELDSAGMDLDYPVVEELHPPSPAERSVPDQTSRSKAKSAAGSESHSLSGRGTKSTPPPISRSMEVGSTSPSAPSSTSIVIPTTPLTKVNGTNDEEHGHRSPILLSPRAKKRLEIFDRAMMEIELREEKEKEQRLEDVRKSREEEEEDGEKVVAGGGRRELGFVRTSEEKSLKGKDTEQMKEDKARTPTPKPPEIKKRKRAEPSDESDSQDKPALRPENSVGNEGDQSVEADLAVASNDIDMDTQTSTGIVEQQLYPIHLRQEEEESTQDLMAELLLYQQQQGFGVKESEALVPETTNDTGDPPSIQIDSQPISEALLDTGVQNRDAGDNEKSDRSLDEIPSIIVENPSRDLLPRSDSSQEDGDGMASRKAGPRTFKSRSRSRSVSSQQNKNQESDPVIPPTASTHQESNQALSQPAGSQTESAENPHYLGAAMHLLNTKSEEISKLEDQLSAEQRRNKELLQQLSVLQLHLTEPTNAAPSATKDLEQELAEVRAQLALKTASWEIDRAALVLDIETATRGKESAEKDRDFFREQYAMASGFVTSVRDENAELEKRIKIATDQSQSGVSLIKSTFELRTKSLEKDVRAWRTMAEFLVEKDRRTNDDIRRRAAEEPELRAKCDRQDSALEDTSERLFRLEADLEEKDKMLLEEQEFGKKWQEETVKLNLELNEAMTKLERIGKVGIDDGEESAHPKGHEFVYRCQWRPDDLNDACEAVFLNNSELEEHLYTGGHLHSTD